MKNNNSKMIKVVALVTLMSGQFALPMMRSRFGRWVGNYAQRTLGRQQPAVVLALGLNGKSNSLVPVVVNQKRTFQTQGEFQQAMMQMMLDNSYGNFDVVTSKDGHWWNDEFKAYWKQNNEKLQNHKERAVVQYENALQDFDAKVKTELGESEFNEDNYDAIMHTVFDHWQERSEEIRSEYVLDFVRFVLQDYVDTDAVQVRYFKSNVEHADIAADDTPFALACGSPEHGQYLFLNKETFNDQKIMQAQQSLVLRTMLVNSLIHEAHHIKYGHHAQTIRYVATYGEKAFTPYSQMLSMLNEMFVEEQALYSIIGMPGLFDQLDNREENVRAISTLKILRMMEERFKELPLPMFGNCLKNIVRAVGLPLQEDQKIR